MKLFRKKQLPDETDIVYEKWSTSFSILQDHRFLPEKGDSYESEIERGALTLRLGRKNLFAWTDDPLYRYENFSLTAEIEMDPANGYSSAGFLFRRIDGSSYYYILVSNRGHFRLDSVLNGSPESLIDWTPVAGDDFSSFRLQLLADGSRLRVFLNDRWAGELRDERLVAGGLSFAGQNYDEGEQAAFRLKRLSIESRPLELEKIVEKRAAQAAETSAILSFAESQIRLGRIEVALTGLRRAVAASPHDAQLLMAAADCCLRLSLFPEAASLLDRVPENERGSRYLMCRAGMLYLSNDFTALKALLTPDDDGKLPEGAGSAAALNLLGNADFALGCWDEAAAAYLAAASAAEGSPAESSAGSASDLSGTAAIFTLNAARALEKAGRKDEALESYAAAARMYFREDEYEELMNMLPFIEAIDADSQEAKAIRAKILFCEQRYEEAAKIFAALVKQDTADSGVYYLYAVIEARAGKKRKASGLFKKAVEREPEYYLYRFKKAEFSFLSGGRYRADLDAALELAPEDPWVLNLAGLAELQEGRPAEAAGCFEKALGKLEPGKPEHEGDEILVNLSEALYRCGRTEDAFGVLDSQRPAVLNQRGNLLAAETDYASACDSYEKALAAAPGDRDIMLNLAAACIEADVYSRAEELLVKILETDESAPAFNLMGNLALLRGESARAEAAFMKALEIDPLLSEALCNLAVFYMKRERLNDADMLLAGWSGSDDSGRVDELKRQLFEKRMEIHNCSECGREWAVPRVMPAQGALRLVGEPPDDMPAGKCGDCGAVYCIGCAKEHVEDGRLGCAVCGGALKLNEEWMRYLHKLNMLDK